MPRGGPDASWLDRLLQTDRLEYLDRDDVEEGVKRDVIAALQRVGSVFGEHDRNVRLVLEEVAGIADPRILELGAGHGELSLRLLTEHPTAKVTVSDVNPEWVAAMTAGELGDNPRAEVRVLDATAIDAGDDSFDLRCSRCRSTTCRRCWPRRSWPRRPGWQARCSSSICPGRRRRFI